MKIPLAKPIFNQEMENAAIQALRNERFILGESVFKFEEEFAKYCGTDYAVSTSSGTDALRLALLAAGLTRDEAVVTTPASFIATANAIVHAQGQPLFADIDLDTYTISPKAIEKSITSKTKAIIPVHLYGYPSDMDSINSIAKKHNLIVIEDCCQAHGASLHGKKTGSLGSLGCFSFYSSKNMMVCGDGGMVTTNNEKLAHQVAKLRDCGRKSQYVHDEIGYTSRLNNVNAAIGRVQLGLLDVWNDSRRNTAKIYNEQLQGVGDIILPPQSSVDNIPVYHLYVIRTKYRDELKEYLESQSIGCGIHYALPIHLQPIYQNLYGFTEGIYPQAEKLCKMCISIPMYPTMSKSEIFFICEKINGFFSIKR